MATKSGKHHYTATFEIIGRTGLKNWFCADYKFSAKDPDVYIKRVVADYAKRGEMAIFSNVIDLDQ